MTASDVAVSGRVAVATAESLIRPGLPDALFVVGLPFPAVTASSPVDGDVGVALQAAPWIELNEPVSDASPATVKLVRLDGSASGVVVPAAVSVSGGRVTVVPEQLLQPSTSYHLRAEGLHSAATGSPMPGSFLAEFGTARSAGSVALSVTSLSPRQGPSAGGTAVSVQGTGFTPDLEARFNGAVAEVVSVDAAGTSAQLLTPAAAAGPATLTLRVPGGGQLDRVGAYLYVDPLTVTAVTPPRGPTAGGTRVAVTGTGFSPTGAVQVRFGSRAALNVRVVGLGRIEAVTPDGLRGPVDVTVVNPDGETATLPGGFIFDQPSASSVALGPALKEAVVVGELAYVVGGSRLQIVDLSGLYRYGPLAGLPIPPDRRATLIDENRDQVDDRIVSTLGLPGEATSISYPIEGGDRMFVGLISGRDKVGNIAAGAVAELDVSDPALPRVAAQAVAGAHGVFGVDARGDRLMAAAAQSGLHSFDISVKPFPVHQAPVIPGAQAVAVREGLSAVGAGIRDAQDQVGAGTLQLWNIEGAPVLLGQLPMAVQRVRLPRQDLAVVAAGAEGLVLVDVTDPSAPARLSSLAVGGFAWDVRVSGQLAYVASGAGGVAVVDITDVLAPQLRYHVTGALGGEARGVAVGGSRLLSLRNRGADGWSLDFGPPAELTVTSATVAPGEIVPTDLPSVTAFCSTAVTSTSAAEAFSFTADGAPVPGVLEAGGPDDLRSTLLYRLSQPLSPGAALQLSISTALHTPDDKALIAPFALSFTAASGSGKRPYLAQVVPRVGPVAGGATAEILGDDFQDGVRVFIGGVEAAVIATSRTRVTVVVPGGAVGLADVVVRNPNGLFARRSGGYLYAAPTLALSASPRFLNPRGGSTVRVTGDGFLPSWFSPLGSTRVLVRGLPARDVNVISFNELTAVAPPGSFGAADVMAVSPDGIERSTAPSEVGYGLSFSAEERAVAVGPHALVADPNLPLLLYSAAGAGGGANHFPQPYIGSITGAGTITESFRVATYDASLPGRPRAAGAQIVDPPDELVDRFFAIRLRYIRNEPLPDIEIMPDSLDVAVGGDNLYVANGQSGLVVIDATDPLRLPVRGRAPLDGELATRVIPTPNGAWVLASGMAIDPLDQDCPGLLHASGYRGEIALVDARRPADPLIVDRMSSSGDVFGATVAGGRLFAVTGQHDGVYFCSQEDPTKLPPPPEFSIKGHERGDHNTVYKGGGPSGSLRIYASSSPSAPMVGELSYPHNLTDVVVVGDVAIVSAAELGLLFIDVLDPANPVELTRIRFDESLSNTPGHPQRLRLYGDLLLVSAADGGVVLVDVSNPRQPRLVSGGNVEHATDAVPVGDRLLLAGRDRVTELSVPFLYVRGYSPARGALVPPEGLELSVRFDRPLAPPSVSSTSVRLTGPEGEVSTTLTVVADPGTQTYAVKVVPDGDLTPNSTYTLQASTAVADQRGGSLLLPFQLAFQTAAAGSRTPRL
ncbi:MAG TPA: IPT/TIG domain-containing protein, partial [Myxococcales bacterium]|nr:IPT/TIG domain-containing protein [Myxococcales bacterium]